MKIAYNICISVIIELILRDMENFILKYALNNAVYVYVLSNTAKRIVFDENGMSVADIPKYMIKNVKRRTLYECNT